MDETTLQVYSVLFVAITVVLAATARFFQTRPGRRRKQRQLDGVERIPTWTTRGIESNRPLHLSFGGSDVGGEGTPAALAQAEFFHQIIQGAKASDAAPLVTMSTPATLPLGQATLRRAWAKGDASARAQWIPPDLAFAGALTASLDIDKPEAHILAGRFGPELALMLDGANRRGQATLALSDRLDGQAVAYALADHVLIGEELYAAPGYDSERGRGDSAVLDVWRALIIAGASVLLLLEYARRAAPLNWTLVLAAAAILIVLGLIFSRRR